MACLEEIKRKIEEYLEPVIRVGGFELIELALLPVKGGIILRLIINSPQGVSLKDCVDMNKKLSKLLDDTDFFQSSYTLEVSSPGLDRIIRTEKEYRCLKGKELVFKGKNGNITEGFLTEVKDGILTVETKQGCVNMRISDIESSKQKIKVSEAKK